jgi:hypothetical protein
MCVCLPGYTLVTLCLSLDVQVRETVISVADYSVYVQGLPEDATEQQVRERTAHTDALSFQPSPPPSFTPGSGALQRPVQPLGAGLDGRLLLLEVLHRAQDSQAATLLSARGAWGCATAAEAAH